VRYEAAKPALIQQLADEAKAGKLAINPKTGHLFRPRGACIFCPILEVGPCDYVNEIQPLTLTPGLAAEGMTTVDHLEEKREQTAMLEKFTQNEPAAALAWAGTDEA
jgi:hypothetical protein